MKHIPGIKKIVLLASASALLCSLCGCMLVSTPEELYTLPQLPFTYSALEGEITALLNRGYDYAAPTAGDNVQSVQMVDLDNDGADEAMAFFRNSSDEKPLKICIFRATGDGYALVATIESSGTAIDRIDYRDLNDDGRMELVVGWRMSSEKVMTVYNLDGYDPQSVIETSYNQYVIGDLDGDGETELTTVYSGADGSCNAAVYRWNAGAMEQEATAKLSVTPAMLSAVKMGVLRGDTSALFVTGDFDEQQSITDVLRYDGKALTNLTLDAQTGISRLVYRATTLKPYDIDQDGVTELPIPYELPHVEGETQTYWGIDWVAIDQNGQQSTVETTYHNLTDGWYLVLPASWHGGLSVSSVVSSSGERAVTFAIVQGQDTAPLEIMTIYTETGDAREYKATRGNRFVLMREATTVYAAEFLRGNGQWSGALDQDGLKSAFHLIRMEWTMDT